MEEGNHRRGAEIAEGYTEAQAEDSLDDPITRAVIGAAIAVHRVLGPGLLESAYQACLAHELTKRGIQFQREVFLPVTYDGVRINCGYRIDFLIADTVILELKCVEKVANIHLAQLLTYLRLSGKQCGLLINFNETLLKNGLYRRILSSPRPSPSLPQSSSYSLPSSSSASSAPLR